MTTLIFLITFNLLQSLSFNSTIISDGVSPNQDDIITYVFMARLKDEINKVNATINDSTIFTVGKGQFFLYNNYAHTAFLANGQFAYIPPEQISKVDTPFFKFNFSKWKFIKEENCILYKAAKRGGLDLNVIIRGIQNKEFTALMKFYKMQRILDGASAEEYTEDFWALINLWSDKELSAFIKTLSNNDKKEFYNLLLESSFCDPTSYYKLYYPLTLKQINSVE
jgi:hypothetical protein